MASSIDVASVGDNCIDRYLPPVDASTVGGNAVNVAVQVARKGHRVSYFGATGDDADGRRMRTCFAANALDLTGVQVRPGLPTAWTDIATDETGERTMVFEEFGACRGYRPTNDDVARLLRQRHVHIGWLDDGGDLKRRLAQAGVSVSQDISVNAAQDDVSPDGLSIAFASAGPSEEAANALLRRCLDGGARLAVVTCGPRGSLASDGGVIVAMPAIQARVVDTLGAGDSLIAGFLDACLGGATLSDALRLGAELAAETCGHLGGFPQAISRAR